MKSFCQLLLTSGLCLMLAACGFHLRGSSSVGIPAESIYLDIRGGGQIGREVREQLELTDIKLASSATEANYVVRISNQRFHRKELTVSPITGKVEEYELLLSADLSVATGEGKSLLDHDRLSATRDLIFDETAVLSTGDEQQLMREEMTRQIANLALLRTRAVIQNHKTASAATAAN